MNMGLDKQTKTIFIKQSQKPKPHLAKQMEDVEFCAN